MLSISGRLAWKTQKLYILMTMNVIDNFDKCKLHTINGVDYISRLQNSHCLSNSLPMSTIRYRGLSSG